MTSNGRTAIYFTNDAYFGTHHENLKKMDPHHCSGKNVAKGFYFQAMYGSRGYSWGFRGERASIN